ncbi:MAG: tRNA pseudouridine(55) synthase TruB [Chitinophagales bacterium]
MDFAAGEVLLVNKPLGWTSFDVVNKIRFALKPAYGKLKVGHAGTLDPLATGLLLICTGKKTREAESLQAQQKEYTGTMILGATTPTYDSEMEPDAHFEIGHITEPMILKTASSFLGETEQMPPQFSALKVDGKVAYEQARKGKEIALKPRPITIEKFEITKVEWPQVEFRVVCSKGTYIRSLAFDFGRKLNSGAYLGALCRTASGNYRLEDAWDLQELIAYIKNQPPPLTI